ncbi:MAG TPA: hypothetical protein VI933_02260 [archaeon]|nr:hypothetical protein [archaeon]
MKAEGKLSRIKTGLKDARKRVGDFSGRHTFLVYALPTITGIALGFAYSVADGFERMSEEISRMNLPQTNIDGFTNPDYPSVFEYLRSLLIGENVSVGYENGITCPSDGGCYGWAKSVFMNSRNYHSNIPPLIGGSSGAAISLVGGYSWARNDEELKRS